MDSHKTFSLQESLKAQQALRSIAGLPAEKFPVQAFVGMVSDEIQALREQGHSDAAIASLIREHSSVEVSAEEIAEHYATPEQRHAHE